jgi:putative inorganic carbon (HCO3(-)) transporter
MNKTFQLQKENNSTSKWGFYGLLLVLIFEYLRPNDRFPVLNMLKLNTLIPLSVLALSFFSKNGPPTELILKDKITAWIIFLLMLIGLSMLTADVTLFSFTVFTTVLGYSFLYFIIRKQLTTMERISGYFVLLITLHILLIVLNPSLILNPETRNYLIGGPFIGDGNDFAVSACTVFPMSYYLMQTSDRLFRKALWFISTFILTLSIVSTQSRGGTIALACVIFYLFMKSRKKALGFVYVLITILGVVLFAPQQYYDRMASTINYQEEGSAMGRIMAWKSAVRMAAEHPLLGVGAGHFAVKYGTEYRPPGYGPTDLPWSTAHSMYFLALGELGLPGFIFLVGILILGFTHLSRQSGLLKQTSGEVCKRYMSLMNCLFASLLGLAIGGAFLSVLYYPHLYLLVVY